MRARATAAINNLKSLSSLLSRWGAGLRAPMRALWSVLTFSAADERIAPGKDLCIALEHSGFSLAYGTRFLSRIRIAGARSFQPEGQGYPQPEDVASSAALAFGEFGAAGANVTLSIPKAWAVVKTVELPAVVRGNLPDVMAYELDRLTPFSSDKAYYDFRVLHESQDKLAVAVVAAKADILARYLDALKDRGIEVGRVTTNLSGIGALWSFAHKGKDVLFSELRNDGYEGALYIHGSLAGVLSGSFTAADEKSRTGEMTAGLGPLAALAERLGRPLRSIVRAEDRDAGLKEVLSTRIKHDIPGNPKDLPLSALGGVVESLSPGVRRMDLLKKGRHERLKPPIAVTVLCLFAVLILGVSFLVAPLKEEEEKLREIGRQVKLKRKAIRDVELLKKELDEVKGELSSINEFKGRSPMSVAILKELTDILPASAWLSRVKITGTAVEIEGYANSATGLLPRLEASRLFGKAEFTAPTYRDARKNLDHFNIKLEIKGSQEKKEASPENAKK